MKNNRYLRAVVCVLVLCLFLGLAPWYTGIVRAAEIPTTTTFDFESALDSETGLPANWTWVAAGKQFASERIVDPANKTNHVFKVGGEATL